MNQSSNDIKPSKRKVLFINPKFQLSFIFHMLGMALGVISIFWAANSYFFWEFYKKGQEIGLDNSHVFFKFLAEQQSSLNYIYIITSLLCFVFLLVVGLLLSHRVAGPLYRFRNHLNNLYIKGDLAEVEFREKDYFQEIAEAFNQFIKKIKQH